MKRKNDITIILDMLGVNYTTLGMALNDIEYTELLYKEHLKKGILDIESIKYQLIHFGKLDNNDAVILINY